jgi:hypothetical protein
VVLQFGVVGLAIFGIVICVFWFPIGYILGRRYEGLNSGEIIDTLGRSH